MSTLARTSPCSSGVSRSKGEAWKLKALGMARMLGVPACASVTGRLVSFDSGHVQSRAQPAAPSVRRVCTLRFQMRSAAASGSLEAPSARSMLSSRSRCSVGCGERLVKFCRSFAHGLW